MQLHIELVLAVAQEFQNQALEAQALINLASDYDSLEDYQQALELAEQGLVIAQELQDRGLEAKALEAISDIYYSLNDYQKSLEFVQRSLAIAQEINSPVGEVQKNAFSYCIC